MILISNNKAKVKLHLKSLKIFMNLELILVAWDYFSAIIDFKYCDCPLSNPETKQKL